MLLAQSSVCGQQQAVRPIVLNNATLVDVIAGAPRSGMTIVITANSISAVGRSREIRIPDQANVIDATGKWLIPGLIEMHTHGSAQFDNPLALYVANGVT